MFLFRLLLLIFFSVSIQAETFPRPKSLRPNIEFWKDIYSKYSSNQVVFSDYDDLSIIYKVIDVPSNWNARKKAVKKARKDLSLALKKLHQLQPSSGARLRGDMRSAYYALKKKPKKNRYKRWNNIRSQTGLKDKFERGYRFCGAHEQEIKTRLKQAGLPEELIAIAFVESLFHPSSKSSSGATGIWQFMRQTAHEFMCVNHLVDERLDPILSTEAAIDYLKSAKETLKTWPLAITSYNYGRNGMARIVKTVGTHDFETILKRYKSKRFGFAAKNYYAEFLAALDVYQNADRLFPRTKLEPEWAYEVLELPKPLNFKDIQKIKSLDPEWLKKHNPALTKRVLRGKHILPEGFTLRVPQQKKEVIKKEIKRLPGRKNRFGRHYRFTDLPAPMTISAD